MGDIHRRWITSLFRASSWDTWPSPGTYLSPTTQHNLITVNCNVKVFLKYFLFDKSCGIIVESSLFVDFLGYIYPWIFVPTKINVYQTNELSYIEMKQNRYLQIYLLQNFHNPWKLSPTNKNDSTEKLIFFLLTYIYIDITLPRIMSKRFRNSSANMIVWRTLSSWPVGMSYSGLWK